MIDTLKLARRLHDANMSQEQAEAIAEGLNESLKESYVSKEFLQSELAKLKADMLWATFVIVFAIVGLMNGVLYWGLSNLIHSLK